MEKILLVFNTVCSIRLSCSKDVHPGLSSITSFPASIHSIAKSALLLGMSAIKTRSISGFDNKLFLSISLLIVGYFSLKSSVILLSPSFHQPTHSQPRSSIPFN